MEFKETSIYTDEVKRFYKKSDMADLTPKQIALLKKQFLGE